MKPNETQPAEHRLRVLQFCGEHGCFRGKSPHLVFVETRAPRAPLARAGAAVHSATQTAPARLAGSGARSPPAVAPTEAQPRQGKGVCVAGAVLPLAAPALPQRQHHRAPDRRYRRPHTRPMALTPKGKPKPYRRAPVLRRPKRYRPIAPGEGIGRDAIQRRMGNLKTYSLTAIDECSGYAPALAVPYRNSHYSSHFFKLCSRLMPFSLHPVITDNGAEFQSHFAKLRKHNPVRHLHTYPNTPKMNAHAERFNRTLQEQFVDCHEALLFDDIHAFNQKLADWLILDNSVRPHKGQGLKTPLQSILHHHPQCNMGWTYTDACKLCA